MKSLTPIFDLMRCLTRTLLLLLAVSLPSLGLDPSKTLAQYAHRIWGQEEGLFQPTIYSMLQSRSGFLWLGTQDRLIRFDGMHFRQIDIAEGKSNSPSLIPALFEDEKQNLWVGTLGDGLVRIAPDGSVRRFTSADGIRSQSVFCVAGGKSGAVWACTDQGLAHFDGRMFRTYTTADGLPSNQVRRACETPNGTTYVSGINFPLLRRVDSRFETATKDQRLLKQDVRAMLCASDGSVWLGTDEGLFYLSDGRVQQFTTREGLADNSISSLAQDRDGNVWIGSNDGISRYRRGEFSVYRTSDGLSHSVVSSLLVDREGTLWAGTKNGLDQFTDSKVTPYTTNQGLVSNRTGPVVEDKRGRLWAGTLGAGLARFDGRHFEHLDKRSGLVDNTILSLLVDDKDNLWVGTPRGLNCIADGTAAVTYTSRDGLPEAPVKALFQDVGGTLWAGTAAGLFRFDGRHFAPSALVPESSSIVAIAGGQTAKLFVSTEAPGFYTVFGNSLRSIPLDVTRAVDCYYLDHAKHVAWMGTVGSGLLRWRNGTFTRIRVANGLYDNRIYGILADDRANFWVASSKGIFRVAQKELDDFADGKIPSVSSVPFSTGQLRFECQSGVQPAVTRTRDGRLWFSTTNGLVAIDPNHLLSNSVPPPTQVTAVLVNGKSRGASAHFALKPEERNVEIRYSGLSFVSPEKVEFKYMLEGYDKNWTDAGTRREAFFTNLPPGDFRFRVLARNADGVWSLEPATLTFSIAPQLYQRAWFFPSLAGLAALAGFLAYRQRVRRIKNNFALVIAERTRIARELHDTLLQGLSGLTMQLQALWTRLPASREKQLLSEIIADAGNCSREARQSLTGLRDTYAAPQGFAQKLEQLVRQAAHTASLDVALDIEPMDPGLTPEAEYQLLRVASEAVANTIAHANATQIEVRCGIRDGELQLTLADDGVGFETSIEENRPGHFGLVGMRERAQEICAEIEVQSAAGRGTRILIKLPLSRSAPMDSNPRGGFQHQFR